MLILYVLHKFLIVKSVRVFSSKVVTYGWIDKHRDVVNLVGSLLILLLSVYQKGIVITCGSEM